MTPRLSVLIGAMTYIPWVWSSQNSVGCSLIGTFICSSVFPSLQHVFTPCLMCSWCGIQLWTKLATPPLWQSSLAFSRVKVHNSDKDKVKEMFQNGLLFGEAEIRQRGWAWGWGRVVILFSIGRLLALQRQVGVPPGASDPPLHTVSSSVAQLLVLTGLVSFPQAMLWMPRRETQYLFCLPSMFPTLKSEFLVNSVDGVD